MTILNDTGDCPNPQLMGVHKRPPDSPSSNSHRTEQIKFCGKDMTRLPEHISRCESLQVLDFSNNSLGRGGTDNEDHLVHSFGGLKRLRGLNLSSNEFKRWPSFLNALAELETISLCGNELEDLPESVASFSKLKRLHADFNHIKMLPIKCNSMTSLTTLTLSNNRLKEIPPSLWTLKTLKTLDLRKNSISAANLPTAKTGISQLKHLVLAWNCLKGRLDLSHLTNLAVLDISHNDIEQIDVDMLKELQSMDCSHNQLKALRLHGAALRTLVAKNNDMESFTCSHTPVFMERLKLSRNCLKELPNCVFSSKSLKYLYADHNQLISFPAGMFDSENDQLIVVKMNHNLIEKFPSHLPQRSVRELYLQYNNIRELPDHFFAKFSCLQVLNLSYNQLQRLPSVCKCPNLRHVQLSGNKLTDVSSLESLFRQPTLSLLHLANNGIKNVPDNFFNNCPSLEELSLACNQLQQVSSHITKAKRLRKLFLHSNMMKSLPQLTHLLNLKLLDIANNDFNGLDLEALIPNNLTYLDLSSNPQLQIDPVEFQNLCTQRSVAVVDINSCGINRKLTDVSAIDENVLKLPWCIGLTETEEGITRLFIELQKETAEGQFEALLVFIEADDNDLACQLRRALPGFLRLEKECEETSSNYLKNVLLSSVRFLRAKGQSQNLGITMCQLSAMNNSSPVTMRLATFGKPSSCILGRAGNAIILAQRDGGSLVDADEWMDAMKAADVGITNQFGSGPVTCSPRGPWAAIPDPDVKEIILSAQDKFIVFGDSEFSKIMSAEDVCKTVHASSNPVAAAKSLSETYASFANGKRECVAVISLNGGGGGNPSHKPEQEDVEKYRCWEFMLEQNHKLLFTKELETIHKTIISNGHQRIGTGEPGSWYTSAFSKYRCPLPSHRGRYYCYGSKCE